MVKRITDTNPEAEDFQIKLLRKAGFARRFDLVRSLSKTMIQLSCRGIAHKNPFLSPMNMDILFINLNYGFDLAERVRKYLQEKNHE